MANLLLQVRNFISDAWLKDWTTRILLNRRQWQSCFDGDFSAYGGAWYAELEAGSPARYHSNAMRWNSRLRGFPMLRQSVKRIAALLPRQVPTLPRRTILGPHWVDYGFTIYERGGQGGVAHTDLEGLIPYPRSMFQSRTEAYSAAVALDCAAGGGGLWIDSRRRRIGHYAPPISRKGWKLYAYDRGMLTLFDAFFPHAIENFQLSRESPRRIIFLVHFLYRTDPYPHYQYWL